MASRSTPRFIASRADTSAVNGLPAGSAMPRQSAEFTATVSTSPVASESISRGGRLVPSTAPEAMLCARLLSSGV